MITLSLSLFSRHFNGDMSGGFDSDTISKQPQSTTITRLLIEIMKYLAVSFSSFKHNVGNQSTHLKLQKTLSAWIITMNTVHSHRKLLILRLHKNATKNNSDVALIEILFHC